MDIEHPHNSKEWGIYEKKILGNRTGNGTIHRGSYYHLDYQPMRENEWTLKCNGVELIIRRNLDENAHDFSIAYIPFKTSVGLIGKWLGEKPKTFQERLKEGIVAQLKRINDAEDHIKRLDKSAEKIVKCQMKIDKTLSEIAGANPHSRSVFESANSLEPLTELERQQRINAEALKDQRVGVK